MSKAVKCTYVKEVRDTFLTSTARYMSVEECPVGYMSNDRGDGNNPSPRYIGRENEGRTDARKFRDMEKTLNTRDQIESPISKNNLAFSKGRIH